LSSISPGLSQFNLQTVQLRLIFFSNLPNLVLHGLLHAGYLPVNFKLVEFFLYGRRVLCRCLLLSGLLLGSLKVLHEARHLLRVLRLTFIITWLAAVYLLPRDCRLRGRRLLLFHLAVRHEVVVDVDGRALTSSSATLFVALLVKLALLFDGFNAVAT
jgi:hypothetical protein